MPKLFLFFYQVQNRWTINLSFQTFYQMLYFQNTTNLVSKTSAHMYAERAESQTFHSHCIYMKVYQKSMKRTWKSLIKQGKKNLQD